MFCLVRAELMFGSIFVWRNSFPLLSYQLKRAIIANNVQEQSLPYRIPDIVIVKVLIRSAGWSGFGKQSPQMVRQAFYLDLFKYIKIAFSSRGSEPISLEKS